MWACARGDGGRGRVHVLYQETCGLSGFSCLKAFEQRSTGAVVSVELL